MRWFQWNAFHGGQYKDRYPLTWERLHSLNIGIHGGMTLIESIDALLDYVEACHHRIDQLEIEKDLT